MAAALLSHRQADGTIATHPYKKWQGPHRRLYSLAQLGHPSGDESLRPLFKQEAPVGVPHRMPAGA